MRTVRAASRALFLLAVVALAGGEVALASNLGVRFNKPLVLAGAGNIGNNWTSIPNLNPYGTAAGLCSQTGLVSTGLVRAQITIHNPVTGAFTSVSCGTVNAANLLLPPCQCVRIRSAGPNAPANIVIAGAHDPSVSCTVLLPGAGQIGNLWYSPPYTGTARTVKDICVQANLSAGLTPATLLWMPADGSIPILYSCSSSLAQLTPLITGDCFKIRDTKGPKTFVPEVY